MSALNVSTATSGDQPANARIVLGSLILVAAVANLNLSVANVALPSIGQSFDSSQTTLNLIAVGFSLGLAASVLWFGALGDRYGRKRCPRAWSPRCPALHEVGRCGRSRPGHPLPALSRVITAAPKLAMALGYDVDQGLENQVDPDDE